MWMGLMDNVIFQDLMRHLPAVQSIFGAGGVLPSPSQIIAILIG